MSDQKIEAIYVELDVLLDTRLGTIAKINDDAAEKTLLSSLYHTRDTDCFECVDMAVYKTLYAQRDVVTLSKSACTNALPLLIHLAGVLSEQAIKRPYHNGIKLVVNTYPYQLSNEEYDQLGKAIAAWMQGLAPVELIHLPPENLTPSHCKQAYAMMLVYEYEAWMNLHHRAFKQTQLPEVVMFAPALYFGKKPSDEELAQAVQNAAHPMQALEMLASPLIELRLIDVKYFSIVTNDL